MNMNELSCNARAPAAQGAPTTNLRTKILMFRGFDSSIIIILRGGIPCPIGKFPGKIESSNLRRDNLSREIGRNQRGAKKALAKRGVGANVSKAVSCYRTAS